MSQSPSRFRGSQQAEQGTGGRGEQRTSPAVCMDYEHHDFKVHPTSYTSKQAILKSEEIFWKTSTLSSSKQGEIRPEHQAQTFFQQLGSAQGGAEHSRRHHHEQVSRDARVISLQTATRRRLTPTTGPG
jgi:hypothetical protein